jgi:N-ethylmaleimide reductase
VLVANMGYGAEEANAAIHSGAVDAVAFGRPFIANPDLPERFASNGPLNTADPTTFYSAGPAGYIDYPRLNG